VPLYPFDWVAEVNISGTVQLVPVLAEIFNKNYTFNLPENTKIVRDYQFCDQVYDAGGMKWTVKDFVKIRPEITNFIRSFEI